MGVYFHVGGPGETQLRMLKKLEGVGDQMEGPSRLKMKGLKESERVLITCGT